MGRRASGEEENPTDTHTHNICHSVYNTGINPYYGNNREKLVRYIFSSSLSIFACLFSADDGGGDRGALPYPSSFLACANPFCHAADVAAAVGVVVVVEVVVAVEVVLLLLLFSCACQIVI